MSHCHLFYACEWANVKAAAELCLCDNLNAAHHMQMCLPWSSRHYQLLSLHGKSVEGKTDPCWWKRHRWWQDDHLSCQHLSVGMAPRRLFLWRWQAIQRRRQTTQWGYNDARRCQGYALPQSYSQWVPTNNRPCSGCWTSGKGSAGTSGSSTSSPFSGTEKKTPNYYHNHSMHNFDCYQNFTFWFCIITKGPVPLIKWRLKAVVKVRFYKLFWKYVQWNTSYLMWNV